MPANKRLTNSRAKKSRESASIILQDHEASTSVQLLHANLKKQLSRKSKVTIDGSNVARIETTNLQVLLSFWRSRQKAGGETEWSGISRKLEIAIEQHGMTKVFECHAKTPV
jgi:anti-anti-sigma regulatory factor